MSGRLDLAVLTPEEMGRADRAAIDAGVLGIELMRRAGQLVVDCAAKMCRPGARIAVFCGPGNNGGDGFVAARVLSERGYSVDVLLLKPADCLKGDALLAFREMELEARVVTPELARQVLGKADLVIDALFGAGLDRPLDGHAATLVKMVNESGVPVLAVDLPSGLSGSSGLADGPAVEVRQSVTFFRKKPGHLLFPGRRHCGSVVCGDIGIPDGVLDDIDPKTFVNGPELWVSSWPQPVADGHKYDRGHAVVFSGGMETTGAARLSAQAALRSGAGLVTLATPPAALMVNAAHLTAVMVRSVRGVDGIRSLLEDARLNACLIGPGYGVGEAASASVLAILETDAAVVLDADALTSFAGQADVLWEHLGARNAPVVLTPHDGEFARLFPDLTSLPKLERVRRSAERSGAVVILKGADTVIADPSGITAINDNAPPWLATAGSGDVLAGMVAGLLAQRMPAFEAAAMAVWLHGEAGREAGPGLIAEDLAPALRPVIARLVEKAGR